MGPARDASVQALVRVIVLGKSSELAEHLCDPCPGRLRKIVAKHGEISGMTRAQKITDFDTTLQKAKRLRGLKTDVGPVQETLLARTGVAPVTRAHDPGPCNAKSHGKSRSP